MGLSAVSVGSNIEVEAPPIGSLVPFCRSLPTAKFDSARQLWSCRSTPGISWKLKHGAPEKFEVCDVIDKAAARLEQNRLGQYKPAATQPAKRAVDLWRHQTAGYHFAEGMEATLLSHGMGLGKTLTAITLAANWDCKQILVVCPSSVRGVWRRELSAFYPGEYRAEILDGTQSGSRKIEMADKCIKGASPVRIVVVNYEMIRRKQFAEWAKKIKWDCVIADESHRAKGSSSKTAVVMAALGTRSCRRLALTGTPMPHSPMDLFSQFRFLDCGIFGTSYHWYRNRYAISGPLGHDHIVGFKNQDELGQMMGLLTHEAKITDTDIELPPVQHNTVNVKLSAGCAKAYKSLEKEMVAMVSGGAITAANALVKTLRLAQMTGGHCLDDDGKMIEFEQDKARELKQLLEAISEPAVVFCRFTQDLKIVERIVGEISKTRVGMQRPPLVYGELSGKRNDMTANATMPDHVDVMGVQIQSGGVGVDLTRASYGIYFNHPWSRGEYDQSLARIHRPGQKRPVAYYHLVGTNTIDEVVWRALEKKKRIVDAVFEHMEDGRR